jgi:hypothetical protein
MMMTRKTTLAALAVAAVLGLAGCGSAQASVHSAIPAATVTRIVTRVITPPPVPARPRTTKRRKLKPVTAPVTLPQEPVFFMAGRYSGTRPSSIDISGDGGNVPYDLVWQSWPSGPDGWPGPDATATATGTVILQGCVPSCYDGTHWPTSVTIVLSDPIDGDPVIWGKMTEIDNGRLGTSTYTYPSPWANGAT